ncbi:aspartate/glutamate racemase family protein [Desertibaculum subflavum]|uniref:aspartate/glutamate racemase family protein n=1 Tax=Desertibaculum subflavum TaxID=2268458 RepID=UPI000E67212A
MARLAFLHTADAHVPTFEGLARERAPGLATRHKVEAGLLADALAEGGISPALAARIGAAVRAAAQDADAVLCTCSTIGAAAEAAGRGLGVPVLRVDRVMAEAAVAAARRILIVATVESTLRPTRDLFEEVAASSGREVSCRLQLAAGAFDLFRAGDAAGYAAAIEHAVRAALGDAEVVVLAQASMAPAAERLADLAVPVLTSTTLGFDRAAGLARAISAGSRAG